VVLAVLSWLLPRPRWSVPHARPYLPAPVVVQNCPGHYAAASAAGQSESIVNGIDVLAKTAAGPKGDAVQSVLGMTDRRLVFMMLALAIVLVAVALAA